MYKQERLDSIIDILKKNNYVTVKYLTEELHYSTATINRDLNALLKQKLIRRSYGGVELLKSKSVPLVFRYHKMKAIKRQIGKKAAEFIKNGDTVFIDGSTTAQYIGQYITERTNLTVITNNMALASYLSEYNIQVICLGGKVVEIPSMLYSLETVENARKNKADKMFFSTGGFTSDGKIQTSETYYLMHKVMRENSSESFFLADHEKLNRPCPKFIFDLNDIDYIISDYNFDKHIMMKYKDTNFIKIGAAASG